MAEGKGDDEKCGNGAISPQKAQAPNIERWAISALLFLIIVCFRPQNYKYFFLFREKLVSLSVNSKKNRKSVDQGTALIRLGTDPVNH